MQSGSNDSFVSKRRHVKSHSFACDFEDCGCFGMGGLQCQQCSRSFHEECAVKSGCIFVDGDRDRIICDICSFSANSQVPAGASSALGGDTQLPSSSRALTGDLESHDLRDPSPHDSGNSSRATSPPGIDVHQSQDTVREIQKLSEWLKQQLKETQESILKNNVSLGETNRSLRSLENKLASYDTRISINSADISCMKTKLDSLADQLSASPPAPGAAAMCDSSGASVEVVASELQDRIRRSVNIMVYNLSPSVEQSDPDRVRAALGRIENLNLSNISVRRFSKPTRANAPPPVLVRMSSSEEASRVLRNWKLLPGGVNVTADRTKAQRDLYKKLKEEAVMYNRANPNSSRKVIKYNNGVPFLTNEKN